MRVMHWILGGIWTNDFWMFFLEMRWQYQTVILKVRMKGKKSKKKVTKILRDMESEWVCVCVCVCFESVQKRETESHGPSLEAYNCK